MVKTVRCMASHETRTNIGDIDRNPFVTSGYSRTPREMADLGVEERKAVRRRLKKIRNQYNGEEAND